MQAARLLPFVLALHALAALSCSSSDREGDTPAFVTVPNPAGKGSRLREVGDPKSEKKAASGTNVNVSGAVVLAVDAYDETHNGRSTGTIYVQDLGSQEPYSGCSLYQPSFQPGNLVPGPGDTLNLNGTYQENNSLPIQFAPNAFLVQIAQPSATYLYDSPVPEPVDIDIEDLTTYEKGRRWLNMLVRVKNITLQRDATAASSGRVATNLTTVQNPLTGITDPFPKAPTLVNELYPVESLNLTKGTVIKELVGIVTFFVNMHLAPRSADDIKIE